MIIDSSAVAPLRVLLVEDDDGDALLVEESLADLPIHLELVRATTLREAEQAWRSTIDCVLLDLNLPDATGLDGLRRLQGRGAMAVVVLTGLDDQRQGMEAVGAGAQDYIVKGQVDGTGLHRAIRYSIERHRADVVARELGQARLRAEENARLSRGLLPDPIIEDPDLAHGAQYRPGGGRLLLGGDFYDVVETPDGAVWAVIGDVCGHGPDEAALGVCLRIGWRTLVLAGDAEHTVLPTLQRLLAHERHRPSVFATACMIRIGADRTTLSVWCAGHPLPLLRRDGSWSEAGVQPGLPLGIAPSADWQPTSFVLSRGWELFLYTDGLVEGRTEDRDCLWAEGLLELMNAAGRLSVPEPQGQVDDLLKAVHALTPDQDDDIAVVLLADRGAVDG